MVIADEKEAGDDSTARLKAEKLLRGAYELETAADNIEYYREFAPVYDRQFASALHYTYPQVVADEFKKYYIEDAPVLDVGCGTGLVAQQLIDIGPVDGVDISEEMLSIAEKKGLYRNLYHRDLKLGFGSLAAEFGGVVSAGTFTHGHLGTEVLDNLLEVGRSGCLYCLGINAAHYDAKRFGSVFERFRKDGAVQDYHEVAHSIFSAEEGQHSEDQAIVAVFRKCQL